MCQEIQVQLEILLQKLEIQLLETPLLKNHRQERVILTLEILEGIQCQVEQHGQHLIQDLKQLQVQIDSKVLVQNQQLVQEGHIVLQDRLVGLRVLILDQKVILDQIITSLQEVIIEVIVQHDQDLREVLEVGVKARLQEVGEEGNNQSKIT